MIEIRDEQTDDQDGVRRVNLAAFKNGPEGEVVDKLRQSGVRFHSFVAIDQGEIVGHILFTPVRLEGEEIVGAGLAPMAVLPEWQGQGVGSQMVRHGLAQMRNEEYPFVVVLGHPTYYPRFGFERGSKYKLRCQWDVPDDVFMAAVFDLAVLPKEGGLVRYRSEFDECT